MITNAIYAGSSNTMVKVEPDNTVRRADDEEVLAWVASGNTIGNFVEGVASVRSGRLSSFATDFDTESNADVVSNGQTWTGGASSAMMLDGKANTVTHRGNVSGTIHSKDHMPHTLNPNQIKDVAADVSEAYDVAYTKYQARIVAIGNCGDDVTCILNVV